MHVGIANPGWRGKRSRHSRRIRNLQFYISGKRPMDTLTGIEISAVNNTFRPRHSGRHFADDVFKCIFLKKMLEFRLKIQWRLFPRIQITTNLALVRIMAWRRSGDRSLSEPMMCYLTGAYMRHSALMSYHIEAWTKWPQFQRNLFPIVQFTTSQHWFR